MTTALILRYGCTTTVGKIAGYMQHSVEHGTSPKSCDVLIRFGNISACSKKLAYNGSEQIEDSATKTTARVLFHNRSVTIPPTVLLGSSGKPRYLGLHTKKNLSGKWIARPEVHSGGAGFVIIDNDKTAAMAHLHTSGYLQRLIDKKREFRVHCAHGRVLHVSIKPTMLNGGESNTISWERVPPSRCSASMLRLALKATDAIGLDFAAVDIIEDKKGKFYVLETNTGPSIPGERCPERYARYFDWLIDGFPNRRKHLSHAKLHSVADLFKTPW